MIPLHTELRGNLWGSESKNEQRMCKIENDY